jgi:hypothetical protein
MTYLKERKDFQTRSLNTGLSKAKGRQASFNPEETSPDKAYGAIPNNYPSAQASSYRNVKFSNINEGNPAADKINPALLIDIRNAAVAADVIVEITTAVSGHTSNPDRSRHPSGNAVDIAIIDGIAVSTNSNIKPKVEAFVKELVTRGYAFNKEGSGNQKSVLTFGFENHDNHVHVSNTTQS